MIRDFTQRIIMFTSIVMATVVIAIAGKHFSEFPIFWSVILGLMDGLFILQIEISLKRERLRYEAALKFSRRAFGVSDDGAAMVGTSPITSIKPGSGGYTVVPVTMLGGALGGGGGGQTKGQASATAIIQGGSLVSGPTLRR